MDLLEALRSYQQADEDGVMVLVSRQACDEAAAEIERLRKLWQDAVDDKHAWARREVAAERECCAKIAEENTDFRSLQDFGMQSMCDQLCKNIADSIRARSNSSAT